MIHPYQWLAHEVWLTKKLTTQCSYKTCAFISKHMSCKVVLYVRHSVAPVWQILLRHMRQTLGLRKQAVCNRHLSCFERYFFTTTGAKRSEANIVYTSKQRNESVQTSLKLHASGKQRIRQDALESKQQSQQRMRDVGAIWSLRTNILRHMPEWRGGNCLLVVTLILSRSDAHKNTLILLFLPVFLNESFVAY